MSNISDQQYIDALMAAELGTITPSEQEEIAFAVSEVRLCLQRMNVIGGTLEERCIMFKRAHREYFPDMFVDEIPIRYKDALHFRDMFEECDALYTILSDYFILYHRVWDILTVYGDRIANYRSYFQGNGPAQVILLPSREFVHLCVPFHPNSLRYWLAYIESLIGFYKKGYDRVMPVLVLESEIFKPSRFDSLAHLTPEFLREIVDEFNREADDSDEYYRYPNVVMPLNE